jgi:hypothetical protein
VNEALREHVTSNAFVLTLGKTQIAALVYLDACIRSRAYIPTRGGPWSHFVPGIQGCQRRGLVTYCYDDKWPSKRPGSHLGRHYTITKAGRLMRDLLKEAGIWQEYEDALPRLAAVS